MAETLEGSAGRYAIFGEIASGGMATVHIGRLLGPGGFARTVAVKRLHAQYAKDPDFVAMFLDEARLAARVRHPNVIPALDVVATGDQLLLVMEYVSGESLARLLRATSARRERVPPNIASAILVGVLHGLHAAHEAKNDFGEPLGIVHRDISPQNVLVGSDGVARVFDFGVAKAVDRIRSTDGSQIKGKAAYMAPEQARGLTVTRKADIFAASVVLWEALAMQRLFVAENSAAVMQKILAMSVPPPSSIDRGLPPSVDDVVLRGLERDPLRRWGTARDMALALERVLPPALPSEVGDWVEDVAKDTLSTRAARIAEIESNSAVSQRPSAEIIPSSEFIADALWPGLSGPGRSQAAPPPAKIDSPATPSRPSARPPGPPPASHAHEPPIELAAPVARSTPPPREQPRPWLAIVLRKAGVAAVAAMAAVGVLAIILPHYIHERAVDAAAEQGLALTIDDVSVGLRGVRLLGVGASSAEMPAVRINAAELHVELSWLEPKLVTVRGLEIAVDGPFVDVALAAERWHAAHHAEAPGADGGHSSGGGLRVTVPLVHVVWTHAFAGDTRLEIPDGAAELTPGASTRLGDEYHFTTQKLTLTTTAGALGPWRVDLDREINGSRVRIALDPPVPDGPNVLLVQSTSGQRTLDANIPRSPLYRIGIPPALAALVPGTPQQIEAKAHYAWIAPGRVELDLAFTLVGAKVPKAPAPVDLAFAGAVSGDPRSLDLKNGTLMAPPIKAFVEGPVTLDDGALRATLAWKASPVPCAQLAPPELKQGLQAAGDLTKQLGSLGDVGDLGDVGELKKQLAGMGLDVSGVDVSGTPAPRISGTLSANGTIVIDTSDWSKSAFTVKTKNSCGLTVFKGM